MVDNLHPQNLLQKLEEKVTMLLIHLDEAQEKNRHLEHEVAQLKEQFENNTNKLKNILDLLDETVKTSESNVVVNISAPSPVREAEVLSS